MKTAEETRNIVRNTDKYLHIMEKIEVAAGLGEPQVLCWSDDYEWPKDFLMWVSDDLKNFGYVTEVEDTGKWLRLTIKW